MLLNKKKKDLLDEMLKSEITGAVLAMIKNNESVTMEELAKKIGVAKGTLYNYFDSKDELLKHVMEVVVKPIRDSVSEVFNDNEATPFQKITNFIDVILNQDDELSSFFKFAQSFRTVAEEEKEKYEFAIKPLSKAFDEGIKNGQFIDVDSTMLAEMIFGTLVGTLKSSQFRGIDAPDLERIRQDIILIMNKIIIK